MKPLLIFFFIYFSLTLFSQEIKVSPTNPEFLQYINNTKNKQYTEDGYPLNYFPPPVIPHFKNHDNKSNKSYPSHFDLRDSLFVSSPKDQASCGCCWAFSVLGSIESNWLKNKLGEFDLSEENMKNCHGFEVGGCTSGNAQIAEAYLTRKGPVNEIDAPYFDVNNPCTENFQPVALITSSLYFPDNNSVIKQAIIDYGGLYSNMYWRNASFNSSNYTYYYKDTNNVNHAVLIIGWDDNIITAGGKGAWIVKNSWGESWGENGYFYISYNDKKFLSSVACFPKNMPVNNQMNLYYYDKLGRTSDIGYSSDIAYALVRFKVVSSQKLSKIGIIINTENTQLMVEIFSEKEGHNLKNRLGSINHYTCGYPGYYTIDLPESIHFNKGENIYIKVRYNTPGYNYPISAENFAENYSDPEIEKDVCWLSRNGEIWEALGNNISGQEYDLCIRAYMFPDSLPANSSANVKIYPNPSDRYLNIEYMYYGEDRFTLEIFNIFGSMVYNQTIVKNSDQFIQRLDLKILSKGMYFVKFKSKQVSVETKLIKL